MYDTNQDEINWQLINLEEDEESHALRYLV